MKRNHLILALTAITTATLGTAYAARSTENDALVIEGAKISLAQAVTKAEQHVKGKASRAEYERSEGQWVFDVEVTKGKTVMDVTVDPASGAVLTATEDKTDHDDRYDRPDHPERLN